MSFVLPLRHQPTLRMMDAVYGRLIAGVVLVGVVACDNEPVSGLDGVDGGVATDADAGDVRDAGETLPDAATADAGMITPSGCAPSFISVNRIGLQPQLTATPIPARVSAGRDHFDVGVSFAYDQNGQPTSGISGRRFGERDSGALSLFNLQEPTTAIHAFVPMTSGYAVVFTGGVRSDLSSEGLSVAIFEGLMEQASMVHRPSGASVEILGAVAEGDELLTLSRRDTQVDLTRLSVGRIEQSRYDAMTRRGVWSVRVAGTTYVLVTGRSLTDDELFLSSIEGLVVGPERTLDLPLAAVVMEAVAFRDTIVLLARQDARLLLMTLDPRLGTIASGATLDVNLRAGPAHLAVTRDHVAVVHWDENDPAPRAYMFTASLTMIGDGPFEPNIELTGQRLGFSVAATEETFAFSASQIASGGAIEHALVRFDTCAP